MSRHISDGKVSNKNQSGKFFCVKKHKKVPWRAHCCLRMEYGCCFLNRSLYSEPVQGETLSEKNSEELYGKQRCRHCLNLHCGNHRGLGLQGKFHNLRHQRSRSGSLLDITYYKGIDQVNTSPGTATMYGLPPSAITTESSTSIGVTPTAASLW